MVFTLSSVDGCGSDCIRIAPKDDEDIFPCEADFSLVFLQGYPISGNGGGRSNLFLPNSVCGVYSDPTYKMEFAGDSTTSGSVLCRVNSVADVNAAFTGNASKVAVTVSGGETDGPPCSCSTPGVPQGIYVTGVQVTVYSSNPGAFTGAYLHGCGVSLVTSTTPLQDGDTFTTTYNLFVGDGWSAAYDWLFILLGVGIPGLAIVGCCTGFCYRRWRKQHPKVTPTTEPTTDLPQIVTHDTTTTTQHQLPSGAEQEYLTVDEDPVFLQQEQF